MNKAIVDSNTCSNLINPDHPFILCLRKGENLFKGILDCAEKMKIQSASISGLGALDDVTVAYYYLDQKKYESKLFAGMYELVSLNGNITWKDDKLFLHIHATLGLEDHSVVGGHIMDATVGPTAEITIVPLKDKIFREYDAEIGLGLMCAGLSHST